MGEGEEINAKRVGGKGREGEERKEKKERKET